MGNLAFEKVADCRKADVRVRPHVDALGKARLKRGRPEMIEEDEGSHHPTGDLGKSPADLEASAEVMTPRVENEIDQSALPV